MLLHDDVVYRILQWLPVISLLRFKLVCRKWRALIESNDFIKQHLHHHHYNPNLKDKNYSLIHLVEGKDLPFTFPLISIDNFEKPNASVQLDCSDLRESFPLTVYNIVSYNGIVCLYFLDCKGKYSICLWNPATKQSRVLPRSPALTLEMKHSFLQTIIGFGFDVKNNDYKVVNLCKNYRLNEESVEVYNLNTDSWRSVATVLPLTDWWRNPKAPFNNGTCFFWYALNESVVILTFDFSSEMFRSISFPNIDSRVSSVDDASVISDKIACVCNAEDFRKEIWVFDEYGSVNESWVKLYTIDLYSVDRRMPVELLCMNGNCLYITAMGWVYKFDVVTKMVCGYNVVTKEIKNLSTVEIREEGYCMDRGYSNPGIRFCIWELVDFKESLLSVGKGNNE